MAKSPNSKSKPRLFLSCFGFSGKLRRFKSINPAAGHRKRPFSLMRFHSKKPPTVHQPSFPAEKNRSNSESGRFSSKSIESTVTCESSIEGFAVAVPVATNRPGVEMIIRPEEVKNEIVVEKTIFEESSSPKKAANNNQSQLGFSLTRKLESFRSDRFTQTASKNTKSNNNNVQTLSISHSLSFSLPNPSQINQVNERSESGLKVKSGGERRKRHGWAVGMSIVMMTLAIMVVWGRFCAILCTATWIFIVTTLTSILEEYDSIHFLQSDSYSQGLQNKFLLLKGFLYRNPRENLSKQF